VVAAVVVEVIWPIFSDSFLVAVAVVILSEVSVDSEVYSAVPWVEEVELGGVKVMI
jgi:hypothetical protein